MNDTINTPRAELQLKLKADYGYTSDETHTITDAQWGAIQTILMPVAQPTNAPAVKGAASESHGCHGGENSTLPAGTFADEQELLLFQGAELLTGYAQYLNSIGQNSAACGADASAFAITSLISKQQKQAALSSIVPASPAATVPDERRELTEDELIDIFENVTGFNIYSTSAIVEADILGAMLAALAAAPSPEGEGK